MSGPLSFWSHVAASRAQVGQKSGEKVSVCLSPSSRECGIAVGLNRTIGPPQGEGLETEPSLRCSPIASGSNLAPPSAPPSPPPLPAARKPPRRGRRRTTAKKNPLPSLPTPSQAEISVEAEGEGGGRARAVASHSPTTRIRLGSRPLPWPPSPQPGGRGHARPIPTCG